jgi:DNA-binding transcriptional MerR regulator
MKLSQIPINQSLEEKILQNQLPKGILVSENLGIENIEQLLAEADDLIQQINSDAIKDMQEEQRLQVEKHAQELKKIRSIVRGNIEKKSISGSGDMHEAIMEIVKAMRELTTFLT